MLPEHTAIVFHKNHYVIVCNKIRYYADRAFRRRGILFRRWGTGRTRGLGLVEMLLGLAALALACVVTMFVASIPVPVERPRAAPARYVNGVAKRGYAPAPNRPGLRPKRAPAKAGGRRPLPYGQSPRGFIR